MENTILFDSTCFRVAMARRGIRSAVDLARLLDISPSYARHIAGGFVPRPEMRQRLAEVLGVAPDLLWREMPTAADQILARRSS